MTTMRRCSAILLPAAVFSAVLFAVLFVVGLLAIFPARAAADDATNGITNETDIDAVETRQVTAQDTSDVADSDQGSQVAAPPETPAGADALLNSKASSASTEPQDAASALPWKTQATDTASPPQPRLSSPREMLELYNIDESQLRRFTDGQPLGPDEDETLWKILFRIPQFGQAKVEVWSDESPALADLAADPADQQVKFFRVAGRVTQLERVELLPEVASRLEYDHYYRVTMSPDSVPNTAIICSRAVPQAWLNGEPLDEPAACYGLFLKTGAESASGHADLIFAASRMAWYPDHPDQRRGINASFVRLAQMGMDVSLFDDVKQNNGKALNEFDREAFYQLLAVTGQADRESLFQQVDGGFDLEPMLTKPKTQHGRLIKLFGTARRVQKIVVDDRDIQQRFGIDHYYQIDVFVPLGDHEVRVGKNKGDQEGPVFRNAYPVTCCVLNLPPDLPAEQDISQEIELAGFYFKLWAYKTEFVSAYDEQQRQIGPLFLAATPRVYHRQSGTHPFFGWIGGFAFLAAIGGILIGLWLFKRSDKKFERRVLSHQYEVPEGKSLDDADIKSSDGPDFSKLP